MFKLALLFVFVASASACQYAPGTTVTTTTTSTTTVSSTGDVSGVEGGVGLSGADREAIRGSWERAKKNGDIAPAILYRFLNEHQEYKKKFSTFADVPMDKLMKNGNFLAQAFTIMAGLNVVINSLGSNELLAVEMAHLGKTHFERGVTVPMFEQFARIIIDTLDEKLPLSDSEEQAWTHGLTALINGISKSLKPKEDIVNPITKLTPHQVADVQRSWANVKDQRNAIVSKIFISLFKKHASLQSKFSAFRDVPVNDLPTNAAFNEQVALVANRLDSMIDVLKVPLQLGGQIRYMAFSHIPRSVNRAEFQEFSDLLVENLGAKGVTNDDLDSWKGVLSVMVGHIAKIQGL